MLLLTNCTSNDSTKTTAANTKDSIQGNLPGSPNNVNLKLDYFESLPDTINGCGEYFTYDSTEFKKKYIFLSNLSQFAIIKIDGKEIYLTKDSIASKVTNDDSYVAVYKGEGYRVVLTMKQTEAYDEGGFYAGTLLIITADKTESFNIHGEAGC